MDRAAWWSTVHGVPKSWTRLKLLKHSTAQHSMPTINCIVPDCVDFHYCMFPIALYSDYIILWYFHAVFLGVYFFPFLNTQFICVRDEKLVFIIF